MSGLFHFVTVWAAAGRRGWHSARSASRRPSPFPGSIRVGATARALRPTTAPLAVILEARFEHLKQRVQLLGEEVPHVADPDDLVLLFEQAGGDLPSQRGEVANNGAG